MYKKLHILRVARTLKRGGLIAHYTSTVPGIAASPYCPQAVRRLQQFKQRQQPFILIADSMQTAMCHIRYLPPKLRSAMQRLWPGTATVIVPGRPGLPRACYAKGRIALRVDGDPECRRLAKLSGGLILSSSLNRREQALQSPSRRLRMRWHRHLGDVVTYGDRGNTPSTLMLWKRSGFSTLR